MARRGYQTHVYEKNDHVGWRASILTKNWFRFDMGPSRYLMPEVFEQFFASIGENIADHLELIKLEPSYRIYFEDQTHVDIRWDVEKDLPTIEMLEPWSGQRFRDYIATSSKQYEIGMKFVRRNYDSIFDFLTRETIIEWSKINIFLNMDSYVRKHFSSPKVQKILQYPLVFLGTSPFDAPALYNIMSHVDFRQWVFYPKGWIYALIEALTTIGSKYGVTYHTHSPVEKIVVENKKATALVVGGKNIETDIIVCNADMAWAETTLLDPQWQSYDTHYWNKKTFAPSGFIIYIGLDKRFEELTHHTLLFCDDWKENFERIFGRTKALPPNPSLYLCRSSATDDTVAPEGKDNMFVLVPAPNGIYPSDEDVLHYKNHIYETILRYTGIDLRPHLVVEEVFTARDFQSRYNARNGTALWLAHTLMQTALFRPNTISKKIDNLYYVWHTTNPWIGMPMVMISAQLVDQRIATKS